jgi:hypothetical protein
MRTWLIPAAALAALAALALTPDSAEAHPPRVSFAYNFGGPRIYPLNYGTYGQFSGYTFLPPRYYDIGPFWSPGFAPISPYSGFAPGPAYSGFGVGRSDFLPYRSTYTPYGAVGQFSSPGYYVVPSFSRPAYVRPYAAW